MNRSDLESRVRTRWGKVVGALDTDRCEAVLEFRREICVDRIVASLCSVPPAKLREMIEQRMREELVSSVLGDLEAENQRLRAAVEKWGRRAICRQFPSRERRNEQDGEENELKEDLR